MDVNEALIECVKAAGGSKVVGHRLWPEIAADHAQRKLLDCLNNERPAHLTPDQVVLVFRLARDRGCHVGMATLSEMLDYTAPVPVEPRDKTDELRREFVEATRLLAALADKLQMNDARPSLRAAA